MDPDGTPVAFSLDLVGKDLELAVALAAEVGPPARELEVNRAIVWGAISAGLGSADLSAVATFLRRHGAWLPLAAAPAGA